MVTKKVLIVDPKKIKWEPVENAPKGVRVKLLWTDKKTGAVAALAKLPKGFHEARHKHHACMLQKKWLHLSKGRMEHGEEPDSY